MHHIAVATGMLRATTGVVRHTGVGGVGSVSDVGGSAVVLQRRDNQRLGEVHRGRVRQRKHHLTTHPRHQALCVVLKRPC